MSADLAAELIARIGPVRDIRGDMIYGVLGFIQGEPRLGRGGTAWMDAGEWGWRSEIPWDPELDRSSVVDPVLFERCVQLAVLQLHPTAPVLEKEVAVPAEPSRADGAEASPAEQWLTTIQAAQRLQLDRSTLDAMVARAPKDLPGAPARVGEGKQRRHLRWPANKLGEWLAAYRAWESSRGRPPKRR